MFHLEKYSNTSLIIYYIIFKNTQSENIYMYIVKHTEFVNCFIMVCQQYSTIEKSSRQWTLLSEYPQNT